jgi:hypothetical protein
MLTNRLGLPQAIVDAVSNDPYTKGASDISVTQLIQPPYIRKLRGENEVNEDAVDRIWSLVGQVGHGIVERSYPQAYTKAAKGMTTKEVHEAFGVVAERRIFTDVLGWKVSGQFDVIEGDTLSDYKFTSVWSVLGPVKPEWVAQLNLLRLLAIHSGIDVTQLNIIAILRDWSKGKAKQGDYPKHQIAVIPIDVWPLHQTTEYLRRRVLAHQDANPPPCTDVERWKQDDVHAVMKVGRKSAVRLHDLRSNAEQHCGDLGAGHSVVTRPGGFRRCQDYCDVSAVCPQMATEAGF